MRFVNDGERRVDNNGVGNQIRPIDVGCNNQLFAESLRTGQHAAVAMSLAHSARLNGHETNAHRRDVLQPLPTEPSSRIGGLLLHRRTPPRKAASVLSPSSR